MVGENPQIRMILSRRKPLECADANVRLRNASEHTAGHHCPRATPCHRWLPRRAPALWERPVRPWLRRRCIRAAPDPTRTVHHRTARMVSGPSLSNVYRGGHRLCPPLRPAESRDRHRAEGRNHRIGDLNRPWPAVRNRPRFRFRKELPDLPVNRAGQHRSQVPRRDRGLAGSTTVH